MSRLTAFLLLSVLSLSARAAPNEDVKNACKELGASVPVVYSGTAFKDEMREYWSYACVETKPYCIIQPTSVDQVSVAVKILNKYPEAQFVVKSGGHDPNVGHSSISDGIVLALGKMRGATYDQARNAAYVKPGGKWANVIGDLAPNGVAVVGGRLSVVGVAGLVLSGGLSFLSAQHGLAADNIVELETVFPNGTIANINAQNHPTLLRAMKGSNTQFGIVTKMTLNTFQVGTVHGGQKFYTAGSEDSLVEAFQDFTENPVDPKAAVILTLEKIGSTIVPVVFYFYQGATPPQGVFKKFEDVRPLYDNTKTQPYLNLLVSNSLGGASLSSGQRSSFRSATFPNIPGDKGQLQKDVIKTWKENHDKYRGDAYSPLTVTSLALQSFQTFIGEQSEKKGGNAMGLSGDDSPRWVAEYTTLWTDSRDDSLVATMQTNGVDVAQATSNMIAARSGLRVNGKRVETYLPYFMNDAGKGQEVTKSFREYETFRILQKEIDPKGFFQRAGGFKY